MPRILVTRPVPQVVYDLLSGHAEIDRNHEERTLGADELRDRVVGCDGVICTLRDRIDAALLEAASPTLRIVANFAVGVDNIDLDAAKRLGVTVTNTPNVLTDATAELAVGLILATARRFATGDRMVRERRFEGWAPLLLRGQGVGGMRVGIVGAGPIGRRVAKIMRLGFGCHILYYSRSHQLNFESMVGARRVALDSLLGLSDIVSIHCALVPETHHLIDARRLALMAPHAILVNTARGAVVDEEALVDALREERIAGAGLDVYENEPALAPGLADLDNVVLLPHIGSATHATRDMMAMLAAGSVIDVLSGREPNHRVV